MSENTDHFQDDTLHGITNSQQIDNISFSSDHTQTDGTNQRIDLLNQVLIECPEISEFNKELDLENAQSNAKIEHSSNELKSLTQNIDTSTPTPTSSTTTPATILFQLVDIPIEEEQVLLPDNSFITSKVVTDKEKEEIYKRASRTIKLVNTRSINRLNKQSKH